MTGRREYVLGMTDHERIAALTRLGALRPDVFDEVVREDSERQRAIRAHRERRAVPEELEPEWDSEDSNAYQDRVEAGLEPEDDDG